jgi:hypothetical protein
MKRERTRLRVQAWRSQQKSEKPEKHILLKEKDRERKRKERMKIKQMSASDSALKDSVRRKKAEEMRRYRQRKKLRTKQSTSAAPDKEKKKVPSLIMKKKEAVKRTQEWRIKIKLKEAADNSRKTDESKSKGKELSRASVYRHVQRVKDILPRTPKKKAVILKKLVESPGTSKVLSEEGYITKACKKKLQVADDVIETVKESVAEIKGSSDKEKKHAFNVISGSFLKKYGKLRLQKYFQVSHKSRKVQHEWWKQKQRKRRSDTIKADVKESVKQFFLSAEISREVPAKREVVTVKTPTGKETLQKHVMTMTLEEAHKLYKVRNPDHKIGLSSFSKLKPVNVKKVSETSRRSCLCQVCCNMALKVEALTTMKRAAKEQGMPGDIQIDKKSLSDVTFCSYQNQPSVKCVRRNCEKCGVELLRKYLQPIDSMNKNSMITWYHWETIEIKKDDKVKRCVSCVPKETNFQTFLDALEQDMKEYPEHAFRAAWQQKQMGTCIDKLSQRTVAVVMDFSENYSCVFQSEVQSGFFDRNQVTVHPMMCYYKDTVEDKDILVKHAIIGISEETKHDADLAIAFENKALETLESRGVNIEEVHEWTDGCAAQYKGKKAFADISLRKRPPVTRNYFETSHGKNVCDGLGATVKNACYRAVVSNKKVIGNANDVYKFCQDNLQMETADTDRNTVSRREFVFIENVSRNRPESNVKTLAGTRKLHSVKSVGKGYELCTRNLSCYCDACVKGQESDCENSEIVSSWEKRNLDKIGVLKDNNSVELEASAMQTEIKKKKPPLKRKQAPKKPAAKRRRIEETTCSQQQSDATYKSGDFVAVGLKPRKGPICVYVAQIIHTFDKECRLKYMKKSGNVYTWPEQPDMSQELTESIVSKLESPKLINERGQFKFKKLELDNLQARLMKMHKHVCFK